MSRRRPPRALLWSAVGAAVAFPAVACTAGENITTATEVSVLSVEDVILDGVLVDEELLEEFFDEDASLEELIGFIEVSVRIGDGEEAELFALAVDASTLAAAAIAGPDEAAAWCTGSLLEPGQMPVEYVLRVEPEAISVANGEIERFELRATGIDVGIDEGDGSSVGFATGGVTFDIDSMQFEVTDAAIEFGGTWNSAVFAGRSTTGIGVEGALLCG